MLHIICITHGSIIIQHTAYSSEFATVLCLAPWPMMTCYDMYGAADVLQTPHTQAPYSQHVNLMLRACTTPLVVPYTPRGPVTKMSGPSMASPLIPRGAIGKPVYTMLERSITLAGNIVLSQAFQW